MAFCRRSGAGSPGATPRSTSIFAQRPSRAADRLVLSQPPTTLLRATSVVISPLLRSPYRAPTRIATWLPSRPAGAASLLADGRQTCHLPRLLNHLTTCQAAAPRLVARLASVSPRRAR